MKSTTVPFREREEASRKQPAELYHIWWSGGHWYYTSHDQALQFNGVNYVPAALERGTVEYDSQLEVSTMQITAGRTLHPAIRYIAQNPVEPLWIEIKRVHRDMSPMDASVIFIGQIKNVLVKGVTSQAHCVGFEYFLRQPIPIMRYQPQCNWTLFDSRCSLDSDAYKASCQASTDSTKRILTATEVGAQDDGYWVFGYVEWNSHRRMIIKHVGDDIYMRYPILEMNAAVVQVDVWPGCDGGIITCRDKFDNVANFGGHPYVPRDNPTLWE